MPLVQRWQRVLKKQGRKQQRVQRKQLRRQRKAQQKLLKKKHRKQEERVWLQQFDGALPLPAAQLMSQVWWQFVARTDDMGVVHLEPAAVREQPRDPVWCSFSQLWVMAPPPYHDTVMCMDEEGVAHQETVIVDTQAPKSPDWHAGVVRPLGGRQLFRAAQLGLQRYMPHVNLWELVGRDGHPATQRVSQWDGITHISWQECQEEQQRIAEQRALEAAIAEHPSGDCQVQLSVEGVAEAAAPLRCCWGAEQQVGVHSLGVDAAAVALASSVQQPTPEHHLCLDSPSP